MGGGGIGGSEISFCCLNNNRKSILSQSQLAALQFAWHGDPTHWSYQHLHLWIICFTQMKLSLFPQTLQNMHQRQKSSRAYPILTTYYSFLLSASSTVPYPFLKWRGHVHNSSQYRSFQPTKHILNISIPRYCTRIKDPTVNKKPFLPWASWQPCLIIPVTRKAIIHSKHSRNTW